MFNPKVIKNFLTQEECLYLINSVKDVEPWQGGGGDFWESRVLNAITIYKDIDKAAGELLYNVRDRIAESIRQEYSIDDKVYPDLCQIVRWFPGQEQHPHADDMKNIKEEENDWFHHRDYGSVIYLNDEYIGGETYYPTNNFNVTPETGTLLVHPGNEEHLHGVKKIKNSVRYTIASFWTLDKKYYDGWTLTE